MPSRALSVDELFALMGRHGVTGDLAATMVAGARIESGGVPDQVGDSGHSIGLFQMHDQGLGAGLSPQQRADPDFATEFMKSIYTASRAKGESAGRADADLAAFTYMDAERPFGFPDLTSPAAQRFSTEFMQVAGRHAVPQVAQIAVGNTVAVVSRDGLRLRSQPGTSSPVLLTMINGTLATVTGGPQLADGFTWWQLQLNNQTGFAAGEFLENRQVASPGSNLGIGKTAEVTDDGIRLRQGPGLAAPILREMPRGQQGAVVGGPQDSDGFTWWQLRVGGELGWAADRFLTPVASQPTNGGGNLDPTVLELRSWIPLEALIKGSTVDRSSANYDAVIDQFGVDRNPRYAPHDGLTFCNIFVSDVTRAMTAQIPHRINDAGSPDDNGRELTCAGMVAWLHNEGQRFGWTQLLDGAAAQDHANGGQPAIVITPASATFEEEHTAVIRPGVLDGTTGPEMAQAGLRCLNRIHVGKIFAGRSVEFWGSN